MTNAGSMRWNSTRKNVTKGVEMILEIDAGTRVEKTLETASTARTIVMIVADGVAITTQRVKTSIADAKKRSDAGSGSVKTTTTARVPEDTETTKTVAEKDIGTEIDEIVIANGKETIEDSYGMDDADTCLDLKPSSHRSIQRHLLIKFWNIAFFRCQSHETRYGNEHDTSCKLDPSAREATRHPREATFKYHLPSTTRLVCRPYNMAMARDRGKSRQDCEPRSIIWPHLPETSHRASPQPSTTVFCIRALQALGRAYRAEAALLSTLTRNIPTAFCKLHAALRLFTCERYLGILTLDAIASNVGLMDSDRLAALHLFHHLRTLVYRTCRWQRAYAGTSRDSGPV